MLKGCRRITGGAGDSVTTGGGAGDLVTTGGAGVDSVFITGACEVWRVVEKGVCVCVDNSYSIGERHKLLQTQQR